MKLIKVISKRIKAIKVGLVVKALFRLAIRAKHLIRPELNYRKYYLKATPWLTPERKLSLSIPSSKFKFSLIPLIVCLLVVFSFVTLITRISSRKTPKVQAFNPQLSPAPVGTNYLYQNITNGYKVYLGDRLQETKPKVKFEEKDSSAEFSLEQAPNQNTQFKNEDNKAVVYKNIWPGIDLKYSLTEKGVKEEIIISSRDSLSQLTEGKLEFNLNLKNAVPRKSLEGKTSGYFVEPSDGQYVFHIPQPFMTDAADNKSEAVELKIDQNSIISNDGTQNLYTITLIPNQEWLQTAIYPVIIDPSVVHDESSEFSGTKNRIEDAGSSTTPKLRTPYHELPVDLHTVALWHLNETTSGNAQDSSGNGNHQTTGSTSNITTANQKLGAAARTFDGSTNYIRIPDSASLYSNTLTVEAWVKPDAAALASGKTTGIVDHRITLNQWQLTTGSGYVGWAAWDSGGSLVFSISSPGTLEVDRWAHVAGTTDGKTARIFIDGKEVSSGAVSGTIGDVSTAVTIGKNADNAARYFSGVIDEVRISNIARTPEEIKQDAQRYPYGVYTSDTIDLTGNATRVASLDSLEWTDNVSTPGATLDGWPNFKPVIIDSLQIGNTLGNYQTKVQIDYDSNMQSDFDDLRFTSHTQTVSSYGSEATFNSAASDGVAVDTLDSTHIVVAYRDDGGSDYGCARIGTISGTSITYGDENCFTSTAVYSYVDVAVLDSTHFVVASDTRNARIGTVSGTTISYGNNYSFDASSAEYISLTSLSSSKFIIAYRNVGLNGSVKVGTVLSGTTISFGSVTYFGEYIDVVRISTSALDSTHFVLAYNTYMSGYYTKGAAKVVTVSGTSVSLGSTYYFENDDDLYTIYLSVAALDSTHFVVAWQDYDWGVPSYLAKSKIGTVSGSTISYGSESTFNSANTYFIKVSALDVSRFVISYRDEGGSGYGCIRNGSISNSRISYGAESCFNSVSTQYLATTKLEPNKFVVGYKDTGGDTYGHAKVGTVVNTNLDYWIETKTDGVEATVWVEVDTIPASSLTTIWMWYGNGGASAGSSGDNTFYFFDDFNDGSIDTNKWTTSGTVTESTGWARLNRSTSDAKLYSNTAWTSLSGLIIKTKTMLPNSPTSRARYYPSTAADTPMGLTGGDYGLFYDGANAPFEVYFNGAFTDTMLVNNTNYDLEFFMSGTTLREVIKETDTGTVKYSNSATMSGNASTVRYMTFRGTENDNSDFNLDYIYVRNYSSIEPVTGVGADIEFQTRTSSDGSSWEAWKPTTNETQIESMDSVSWKPDEPISSGVCNEFFNFLGTNNTDMSSINGQRYFYTYYAGPATLYGQASAENFLECDGGSNTIYNSASTNYIANDVLDSSYGVVTYQDTGNSSQGTARIGSFLAGEGVTFPGSEYIFNATATNYTSVAALDSTHFAVGYEDDGGDDYGCAQIGTTSSGTTISYGTEYCFNNESTQYVDLTKLDSTHFVVTYQESGFQGCAKVGTVSGSDISYGSEYCFNSGSTVYISVDALNSSHFVVVYSDSGNSGNGTAVIGTVSGSTISYGSEYVFNNANTYYPSVSAFDSSRFVITYRDLGNSSYGTAIGGTVKYDSSIFFTDEHVFYSGTTYYPSVAAMDNGSAYTVGYYRSNAYVYTQTGYINFNRSPIDKQTDSTIKMEGTASNEITVGAPQPDFDTRGLWHLEETGGSGAYVLDETDLSNDLSVSGTASVTDGFFGKARDFHSGDLSCTDAACGGTSKLDYPGSGGWSVGAWVKLDTLASGADQQIAIKWYWNSSTDNGGYVLQLSDATDNFRFGVANSSGSANYNLLTSTTTPSLGQWYYVVGVYNGLNTKIYVNGVLENTAAYSGGIKDISQNFLIGNLTAHYFNGAIDEPFVTAKALTSEEIAEAYRAGRDHRLQRTISSTDLSGKTKVPFYFAADKQGTIAETYVGETDQAVYGVDSSTVALWHLDDNPSDYEGFNSPGTAVDDASVGTLTWSNPSYAKSSDDSRASATVSSGTAYSHYLKATNFGFNIPSNAKIMGIRVQIEKNEASYPTSYVRDENVRIIKSGGIGSTNKAATSTDWPQGTDAYTSYGDAFDLWGETWTASDINASNFGVALSAELYATGFSQTARVDHMRIDVWYAPIKDESANGNMAKSRGGAAYTSSGKIGGARYFDGTDDYLQTPLDLYDLYSAGAFTVEAWAYHTAASGYDTVISSFKSTPYDGFFMRTDSTGNYMQCCMYNAGSSNCTTANLAPLELNTWIHWACTYSSSALKIYKNGGYLDQDASSSMTDPANTVLIGTNYSGNEYWQGMIDEVRVSNTARSADEIRLAYQYGLRTHQVTADYVTTAGSDGPTSTSDYEFTPDSTTNLYKGDTVIVRENYNGTTYIMQGEVSSISSGLVTVASWSGTAPSGGYTTNADVFKWQREYWDLKDISPGDRDTTVRLGLRILDASEGFTMYLDDFRHNTNYLTDSLGSTVTSTANRYIQYRAILSTNNTEITPELTSVTLDYNRAPTAPTSLLTEGQTNPIDITDITPEFSAVYNDDDTFDIANKYQIQVDDDPAFGSTIWDSGAAGTAMNDCVQGDRCQDISYAGSAPTPDTKYYWRIKYWDDQDGEGDWSTTTAYFTVALAPPANCVIEDGNQPDELTVRWDDMSSNETGFRVEKNIDAAGFNYLTDKAADSTSHLDNTTSANHTYQYRVRAEADGTYSLWCTTSTVDLSTAEGANEGFRFEGVRMEGLKLE